jgi:acetolactate decarboxylase
MNKIENKALLIMLFFSIALSCRQSSDELRKNKDVLFQYSTLSSLMAGVFDGDMTYAELKQQGDFGLGTFNALDGEMIEIDHQVYQIKSDGAANPADDKLKAPFAVVTYFEADQTVKITEPMDYGQLKNYVDSLLPTKNIPYAIKITGTFATMQTRSVPRQEKPYPRLSEVIAKQPKFDFQNIEGTLSGFRLPDYMNVANAPGYHFHFITADRKAGGHVLDCQVQKATVEIDYTNEWCTVLPGDSAFYKVNMSNDVQNSEK